MLDTGMNAPESIETLIEQQRRLINGNRAVQMFPAGTKELPMPQNMLRAENLRGVFHYNPNLITEQRLQELSAIGRENEFLELGPYSKAEILQRVAAGEEPMAVVEYTPDGTEVRAALACTSTVAEQAEYFNRTKTLCNIVVCAIPNRVQQVLRSIEQCTTP